MEQAFASEVFLYHVKTGRPSRQRYGCLWFLAFFVFFNTFMRVEGKMVTTKVGDIVGFESSWGDKKLYKFRGIPYAEAPIGNLRFSPPVAKSPFAEPFQADRFGFACPQVKEWLPALAFSAETPNLKMSEDCLNLNIYVPDGGEAKKAVVVWIHGGTFMFGSGMLYDGSKMAAVGDVIVVTINYRLAILGFFSTGDKSASGNYGLLDQQLALKWVNRNIEAFGGDKDRVTIFGESAGGASVTWQMLAPSNEGLFHRVIAESGVALAAWSYPDPEVTAKYTAILAHKLDCTNSDSSQIVACLRNIPTDDLIYQLPKGTTYGRDLGRALIDSLSTYGYPYTENFRGIPGGPRVDGDFIPFSPTSRLPNEKMEDQPFFRSLAFITGLNQYEAAVSLPYYESVCKSETNRSLSDGVPKRVFRDAVKDTGVSSGPGGSVDENMVEALWWLYTTVNGDTKDKMSPKQLMGFIQDSQYSNGTVAFLQSHSAEGSKTSKGSTYMYRFLPMPSEVLRSLSEVMPLKQWIDGSTHTDELIYLFGRGTVKDNEAKMKRAEVELSDALITYWTNFAKTGNPNKPSLVPRQWPQYSVGEEKFIEFDIKDKKLDMRVDSLYRDRYISFWRDVLPRMQGGHERRDETCNAQGVSYSNGPWWKSTRPTVLLLIGLALF